MISLNSQRVMYPKMININIILNSYPSLSPVLIEKLQKRLTRTKVAVKASPEPVEAAKLSPWLPTAQSRTAWARPALPGTPRPPPPRVPNNEFMSSSSKSSLFQSKSKTGSLSGESNYTASRASKPAPAKTDEKKSDFQSYGWEEIGDDDEQEQQEK